MKILVSFWSHSKVSYKFYKIKFYKGMIKAG